MLGQIALLGDAPVSLVQHPGGTFLQQGRKLSRIIQDGDDVAPERIVAVLIHTVGQPHTGEVHLVLIAHERRDVPVNVEGPGNSSEVQKVITL